MKLTAKVRNVPYEVRKIWVDEERFISLREEMYAKSGKLLKVSRTLDVRQIEGRYFPVEVEMSDQLRQNSKTVFTMTDIKFNVPVNNSEFSLRNFEPMIRVDFSAARPRCARNPVIGFVIACFALTAIGPAAHAQSGGLDLSGSLSNDTVLLQNVDGGTPGAAAGASNPSVGGVSKFTLNFVNRNRSAAKVEGSVALSLLYGAYADAYVAGLSSQLGPSYSALVPFLTSNGAVLNFDLRKLYLSVYTDLMDISVGRQIINYGVGTLFSPIDAFSTPALSDLNYERSGSDVIRLELPFGDLSGLDAVTTVSDTLSGLDSAVKLYTNIADYDIAAVGLYRGVDRGLIGGLDFKGDLVLGIHGEAVQHFLFDPWKSYFEGMFGADYSFSGKLFLSAEYYYNGDPAAPGSLSPVEVASAQRVFLNQHYLYSDVRYLLTDLASVGVSGVFDLSAGSVLGTAQYAYNIAQNADLLAYVRCFWGDVRSGISGGSTVQYGAQLRVVF